MRFVGTLVVVMFVGLAAWFAMTVFTQGSIWASDVRNNRLRATNSLRGDITDRNGNLLATTAEDGGEGGVRRVIAAPRDGEDLHDGESLHRISHDG